MILILADHDCDVAAVALPGTSRVLWVGQSRDIVRLGVWLGTAGILCGCAVWQRRDTMRLGTAGILCRYSALG